MSGALPKLTLSVGAVQFLNNTETSKWYWRNWLFVDATCCSQKWMLLKVSNPLNRSHVWVLLEDSLEARQQCGLEDILGYLQPCDRGAVSPIALGNPT